MKKIATFVAACALLAAGTVHAQQSAATASRLYGELGYIHLDVEDNSAGPSLDGHPGVLRGIVGYGLHPYVAVEGMLGFGVRDADTSGTFNGVPFNGEFKVRHMVGLFAKPRFQAGPVEVFGRLGWVNTKVRASATALGTSASASDSDSDFAYGAGLNYNFTPRTYVGFDLMRYYDKGGTKLDGAAINIGMRW
jgi:opacity protein-like surface antigen